MSRTLRQGLGKCLNAMGCILLFVSLPGKLAAQIAPFKDDNRPVISPLETVESLVKVGQFRQAIDVLNHELTRNDPSALRLGLLAALLEHEASTDLEIRKALAVYETAIAADPSSVQAWDGWSRLLLRLSPASESTDVDATLPPQIRGDEFAAVLSMGQPHSAHASEDLDGALKYAKYAQTLFRMGWRDAGNRYVAGAREQALGSALRTYELHKYSECLEKLAAISSKQAFGLHWGLPQWRYRLSRWRDSPRGGDGSWAGVNTRCPGECCGP